MRLVHLTDPHLTSLDATSLWSVEGKRRLGYLSWWRSRRHTHRGDVLRELTRAVHTEAADQIVVTGDLTHLGLPHEIDQASAWLNELGTPDDVTLVPGNHDTYTDAARADVLERWADYLHILRDGADVRRVDAGSGFPTLGSFEDVAVVGLSSAVPSPFFMATGQVGAAQLDRLATTLAHLDDDFACLLLHHPPIAGWPSPRKALTDAAALARVLEGVRAGLVLHGHVHRNTESQLGTGLRVYGTASASSADPTRPASYRVFDIERRDARWCVDMALKTMVDGAISCALRQSWIV